MRLKAGVSILGVKPNVVSGMADVDAAYREINKELIVTSALDGTHKPGSLHYEGLAFDCRTAGLLLKEKYALVERIRMRLGAGWDVIPESDHIHIEFDPKPRP